MLMDSWLDFMDCWSEGLAMPIGAMLMSVMVAAELKPKYILEEVNGNKPGFFYWFYRVCIIVIAPVVMALVLGRSDSGLLHQRGRQQRCFRGDRELHRLLHNPDHRLYLCHSWKQERGLTKEIRINREKSI